MTDEQNSCAYIPTFFARQPIFENGTSVWGYELLYRDAPAAQSATFADEDSATLSVASCACLQPTLGNGKASRAMINFTRRHVLENVPLALPAESTVVKIDVSETDGPEVRQALKKLKDEGYTIALNGFDAQPGKEAIFRLADILIVDAQNKSASHLKAIKSRAPFECRLLAKRVESMEAFRNASAAGYPLLQGFFFQRPETVPGRKLSSNEISRLNLFRIIEKDEPDFDALAALVRTDVAISYRLLSYLNSPAFSFSQKIQSIKQAVILLGWVKVRNWLRLIILSDMLPRQKSSELPYLSAVRGKFLEKTAKEHAGTEEDPASLFLLGLLSLLDALLDMPIEKCLAPLPLDEAITEALCGKQNRYREWLEISLCFETGNWDRLDRIIRSLNLDPLIVSRCYYDSLLWANSFFGHMQACALEDETGA